MRKMIFRGSLLLTAVLLAGCSSTITQDGPPSFNIDVSKIPNATPVPTPISRYGNPPSYRVDGHTYYVMSSAKGYDERGIASWYGMKFYNKRTSDGEEYNVYGMTAASRTLPIPTFVKVTNLENHSWVVVKVNDRGPFDRARILDLSYAAAKKLDVLQHGTAYVEVQAINPYTWNPVTGFDSSWSQTQQTYTNNSTTNAGQPILYLQVGAFSDYANAETLRDRVANLTDVPVFVKQNYASNAAPYKVQIGPVPSVDASDKITQRLESAGFGEPMQVIK